MKKLTAMALILAMVLSLTACGGTSVGDTSTADNSVADTSAADDSTAESEADTESGDASSEDDSTSEDDSSEAAGGIGDFEMEAHSTEHAPLGIKLDYELPKLSMYDAVNTSQANPHYFGTASYDSYFYAKEDKSIYGLNVEIMTSLWSKDALLENCQ